MLCVAWCVNCRLPASHRHGDRVPEPGAGHHWCVNTCKGPTGTQCSAGAADVGGCGRMYSRAACCAAPGILGLDINGWVEPSVRCSCGAPFSPGGASHRARRGCSQPSAELASSAWVALALTSCSTHPSPDVIASLPCLCAGLGVFNYDFGSITQESPVIKVLGRGVNCFAMIGPQSMEAEPARPPRRPPLAAPCIAPLRHAHLPAVDRPAGGVRRAEGG